MNRAAALAATVTVVLGALAACRRAPAESSSAATDASDEARVSEGPSRVLGPRCRPAPRTLEIEPSDEVEIGDAFPSPEWIAFGVVRHTPAGRLSTVAIASAAASDLRLVDLAPTLGDGPPPRAAWRNSDLLVAEYLLRPRAARADGAHELALWAVDPRSPWPATRDAAPALEPFSTIPRQRGDSLGFDLAYAGGRTLIVWDETAAGPSRQGVVRAVMVSGNQTEPARDISPPESDAESARVLSNGAGFFVLWVARRPERAVAPEGGQRGMGEVTGEARALSWLELVAVDAHGNPAGAVQRLTSPAGHVSAYDAVLLASEPKPMVVVVARDDGEAVEGSGGALLRVRAGVDFADPPVELSTDGLGRGAPTLVEGSPPWLSWVDAHERLRLMPLDSNGLAAARSSEEDALGEARPLLWIQRQRDPDELLVVRPRMVPVTDGAAGVDERSAAKAEVAVFVCPR